MRTRRIISDESGITIAVETILMFGISVIFLGMIFLSFQGLNQKQGKILMQEEYLALGNEIAKRMSDMVVEARASLSSGSRTAIESEFSMPVKIADNTYSVKLLAGKIIIESTSGPYVSVEVPLDSNIRVAENSTIQSLSDTYKLEYDSRSSAIFFKDGGVTPPPDFNSPIISIVSPPGGSTLNNTVHINVSVWDDVGVTRVEYYVNGTYEYAAGSSFNWSWDTRAMTDGNYIITAIAYDAAGHTKPASRNYTVYNPVSYPPIVSAFSPPDLSSTDFHRPTIQAQISDDKGINFSSFILLIDSMNQISNATFTTVSPKLTTVNYVPVQSMSESGHNVQLYVKDIDSTVHGTWANWSFNVTPIIDSDNPSTSILSPVLSSDIPPGNPIKVTYIASDNSSGLDNLTINVTRTGGIVYSHKENVSIYPTVVNSIDPPETWTFNATYVSGMNYTFNITVFDRSGKSAFATAGPFNVSLPGQASELEVDTSGLATGPGGKSLNNINLRDNVSDTVTVSIKKITITWNPSGPNIATLKIGPSTYWSGNSPSGTQLTLIPSYTALNTAKSMDLTFNSDIRGKDFTIEFLLGDSTTRTVTFTAP
ncbi:MAG: Ig-like domain-containing protein [Candidatus Methanoperedens sp.]|nr:Ig-like domain-containing protein [Candidatus Methanoperedens sp.]MCZ7371060.1 Ig-like domain-containing protein [Candidatus Methanoperedens sp.]